MTFLLILSYLSFIWSLLLKLHKHCWQFFVRSIYVYDMIENTTRLPFTTRSAWVAVQSKCPDLRRTSTHFKQGTRPSKKLTNIKDVKRYISVPSIVKDNLLVVHRHNTLVPSTKLIIVPRSVLNRLVTALHIKLNHLYKHQLQLVMRLFLCA